MTTLLLILIVVQLLLVIGACWWRKYQPTSLADPRPSTNSARILSAFRRSTMCGISAAKRSGTCLTPSVVTARRPVRSSRGLRWR